ncbi:uncharacterized protein CEXT_761131 [Caerostris extrusa]|uniref:Uncharacterized protein n=1 Tax=Caerostris extrusa TaxID=172846 RepID=A0AAV4R9U4_CAEEX|nr:uncharacterized protein CEXT_761131 [Caerostris extrusa]
MEASRNLLGRPTLQTNKNVVLCSYCFGFWNGAFSADQSCIEGLQWECRNYDLLPDEFPGTEDELKESCSELEEKKKCLMEFLNGCGSNNYDDLEMARSDLPRMINTLTEICQEDTELHASYVQHMACIKRFISTNSEREICHHYVNNAFDYLRGPIQESSFKMMRNIDIKFPDACKYTFIYDINCLYLVRIPLLSMNCFVTYISGSCEYGAGKMTLELMQKAGSIAEQCPSSIRIDVIDLLNAFESATEEQMFVKRLITSLNIS